MIPNIKIYLCLATVISLLTVAGLSRWETYSVKKDFAEYKENINDQVQKAKIEKARIESEQRAKHDKEVADLAADRDRLKRILVGLRKSKDLPRDSSLPLAGGSAGGVSRTPESAERFTATSTPATRIGFTYEDAMMDTLQCSRLQSFLKDTQ
jgi:hypothetical protein